MAVRDRTVHVSPAAYQLVTAEAERRGMHPDVLVDETLLERLARREDDLDVQLSRLAAVRARLSEIDGLSLAREARHEIEHRAA